MRRGIGTKLAMTSAVAALALGAAACDVEDDGTSPGQEDPLLDDGMGGDDVGTDPGGGGDDL